MTWTPGAYLRDEIHPREVFDSGLDLEYGSGRWIAFWQSSDRRLLPWEDDIIGEIVPESGAGAPIVRRLNDAADSPAGFRSRR
jgi:hypothetical protein